MFCSNLLWPFLHWKIYIENHVICSHSITVSLDAPYPLNRTMKSHYCFCYWKQFGISFYAYFVLIFLSEIFFNFYFILGQVFFESPCVSTIMRLISIFSIFEPFNNVEPVTLFHNNTYSFIEPPFIIPHRKFGHSHG